jgi:DegV family protein with EDD domain
MSSTAIVTDSTSDLPQHIADAMGVTVVPLYVTHMGKAYRDGIDITPESFYPMLKESDELPKTSQPSPERFREVYERLLGTYKNIVSFHISGGLSSTVQAAKQAADNLAKNNIHVVDSKFLTYGLAFQVHEALRLAKDGLKARDILSRVSRLRDKIELLFTLNSLEYLYKGGRIGKVESLMGSILGIKPLIRVEDGVYVPAGKSRGLRQALRKIVEYLANRYRKEKVTIAVGHGQGQEFADMLCHLAQETLNVAKEPEVFHVGPVIGVHTGPGTVGIAVRPLVY